jgi:hypothetical protein
MVKNATEIRPAHVLLVADPQIIDRNSYPTRSAFSAYLTRIIVDLNLRKSWRAAIKKNPDAIVFLGDMMDNGRDVMSSAEYGPRCIFLATIIAYPYQNNFRYENYYRRFKDIFKADDSIPQYFIPGNHDIGYVFVNLVNPLNAHAFLMCIIRLGKAIRIAPNAHSRYAVHFGAPNREISIANHSLILFDAPSYADEDAQRHGQKKTAKQWIPRKGGALEFATKFARGKSRI